MEATAPSTSTGSGGLSSCRWAIFFSAAALVLAGCATPQPTQEFGRVLREHPDNGALIHHIPLPPPDPSRTGIAVISSLLDFWDHPASPSRILQWLETDGLRFDPDERLSRFAWSQGLWTHVQAGSLAAIRQRVRSGTPPVVLLQDSITDPASSRQAIVAGFDDRTSRVLCLEPGRRTTAYSYTDFVTKWRVGREWMMTLAPAAPDRWALTPPELLSRARFHEFRGTLTNAFADYSAARQAGVENSSLEVRIGNLHRTLGRPADAESAYRRALELDDQNGRACNNLAYLLAEEDRSLDEAVALARKAMLLEPTNPMAMDTLGYALYRQGSFREASDVLERARARARWLPPATQAEIGLHLALAHQANGQSHLAREVLGHVLELHPEAAVPDTLQPLRHSRATHEAPPPP